MSTMSSGASFKDLLNKHLQASGRPLKDVARQADITDGYLSLLRTGKRGVPPLQVVENIGRALGLGASDLQRLRKAATADRGGKSEDRLAPSERYRAAPASGSGRLESLT